MKSEGWVWVCVCEREEGMHFPHLGSGTPFWTGMNAWQRLNQMPFTFPQESDCLLTGCRRSGALEQKAVHSRTGQDADRAEQSRGESSGGQGPNQPLS